MAEQIALDEFKKGVSLLQKGQSADALEHLRQAAELKRENPIYISFLGLSVARSQRNWAAAMTLCESALTKKRNEPQLYLNMTEVYVAAGRTEDAVETLDAGLKYCGRDRRLLRERANLGVRRPPILPFLRRGHFLNQSLGRLRSLVEEHLKKPQSEPYSPTRLTSPSEHVELR
jgi:tetratricopeptide (TPR) repeat protein